MPFMFFGLLFVDNVNKKTGASKFIYQIIGNFAMSVFIIMQILQNFR